MSKKPQPAALSPVAAKALKQFYEDAAECMLVTGRALLSLTELRAWLAQGRPVKPVSHVYDDGSCLLCGSDETKHYEDAWCPRARLAFA